MKTIIFDMYGVIIKESKGNFIPYTYKCFNESEHERITNLFRVENIFTKAGNGEINSFEFLSILGYNDPIFIMKDYIENHLTIDKGFYDFVNKFSNTYNFALLSNDVSDWSKHITQYYDLDKYFNVKVISGDVHCRKPNIKIYEIILDKLSVPSSECIFIDNSVANLITASKLGMETILFNRDKEKYSGRTVYSFDELSRILREN